MVCGCDALPLGGEVASLVRDQVGRKPFLTTSAKLDSLIRDSVTRWAFFSHIETRTCSRFGLPVIETEAISLRVRACLLR